jgi:hypothetical protein
LPLDSQKGLLDFGVRIPNLEWGDRGALIQSEIAIEIRDL